MPSVIICGSRTFAQPELVNAQVEAIPKDWTVIVGGARGVDRWAETRARTRGLTVLVVPADWNRHGGCRCTPDVLMETGSVCKFAGFRRNLEMIDLAMTDTTGRVVIAFWDGASPGTQHTIEQARKRGMSVKIVRGHGINESVDMAEREALAGRFADAQWRQEASDEREALHQMGMHIVQEDDINPEAVVAADPHNDWAWMEAERLSWPDPFAREADIRRGGHGLPDRFLDPGQLVNYEEYTSAELGRVDFLMEHSPWWNTMLERLINEERPIGPKLYDAINTAIYKIEARQHEYTHV